MKHRSFLSLAIILFSTVLSAQVTKMPAYPLVTHDPYFSIWSFSDRLNEGTTRHWTGKEHSLLGMARVDGKWYNILGKPEWPAGPLLPSGADRPADCRYTLTDPGMEWYKDVFNDQSWLQGKAPFGNGWDNDYVTAWNTKAIWMRRSFELSVAQLNELKNEELVLELRLGRLKRDHQIDRRTELR